MMDYRVTTTTKFIPLHFYLGNHDDVWVNVAKIIYIYRNKIGSTFVCLGSEEESILVAETPEDIFALTRGQKIGGGNAK